MAFGKVSTATDISNEWKTKAHELEMRLNALEFVYLKELERKIAEVAMNASVTKEVNEKAKKAAAAKRGK